MREIKALTSLRGIFALWVLFFHINLWSPFGVKVIPIIDHGYLAVDFFFVLSGFILANAHGATFTSTYVWKDYISFLSRRFGRLFPLHLVVLVFCVAALYISNIPQYWWVYIVDEALLIHRWNIGFASVTAMNPPDWSISTEWAANLLFPAFVWGSLRGANIRAAILGVIAIATLIYVAAKTSWTLDVTSAHSWLPLMRCFAEFSAGLLVFRWRENLTILSSDCAVVTIMTATLCIAWLGADLIAVPFEIALTAGLAKNDGYLSELLSKWPLHLTGKISFSIYLIQIPGLLVVRSISLMFPNYVSVIYVSGTIIGVLGLSWLTYIIVEKQGQKLSAWTWVKVFN